jgi:hypothetical protein
VIGAHAELTWPTDARTTLELGVRSDAWITGSDAQAAVEPRVVLRYQARPRLSLHAAFGLAYQPAVFLIPLPGVADVALDRGLQRAIQSELGAAVEAPASFTIDSKVYLHTYDNMLSFASLDEPSVACDDSLGPSADSEEDLPRMSAYSYGAELMIRRAYRERLSGFLAYTLSWADGRTDAGRELTPNFDVRHVANLVLQWRASERWHVAVRGYAQSGRFPLDADTTLNPLERQRLPMFFRGDLQVARVWQRRWGELRFTFDWLNFTFQREPMGWQCGDLFIDEVQNECRVEYVPFPITIPMLGVRASY